MSKQERVIVLPSITISRQTAEAIDNLLDGLGDEKVNEVITQEAQSLYRQSMVIGIPQQGPQNTEAQVVTSLTADPAYRDLIRRTHGAKYTFISGSGSVQFTGEDYLEDDIPKDLVAILAEARGTGERYVALHIKANTLTNEIGDVNLNRILIQSNTTDRTWVNDVYSRLADMMAKEENTPRHLVYQYMPVFVWAAFLAVVGLQYRILNRLAMFTWDTPLNGLQLLLAFVALAVDLLAVSWIFQKFLHYSFPFFELEGNLSRRRVVWRWPLMTALAALYGPSVWAVFKFILGFN